jgi:hypothetical protein
MIISCRSCGRVGCRSCQHCGDCTSACRCDSLLENDDQTEPADEPALLDRKDLENGAYVLEVEVERESQPAKVRRRALSEPAVLELVSPLIMYRRNLGIVEEILPRCALSRRRLLSSALVFGGFYWNELAHRRALQNLAWRMERRLLPQGIRELRGSQETRSQASELLLQMQQHPAMKTLRRFKALTPGIGDRLLIDLIVEQLFPELTDPTRALEDVAGRMLIGLRVAKQAWFAPTCPIEVPGVIMLQATSKLSTQGSEAEQFLACAAMRLGRPDESAPWPLWQLAAIFEESFGEDFPLADNRRLRRAFERGQGAMPSFDSLHDTWTCMVSAFEAQICKGTGSH